MDVFVSQLFIIYPYWFESVITLYSLQYLNNASVTVNLRRYCIQIAYRGGAKVCFKNSELTVIWWCPILSMNMLADCFIDEDSINRPV